MALACPLAAAPNQPSRAARANLPQPSAELNVYPENLPPMRPPDLPKAVQEWIKRQMPLPASYEPLEWSAPVYMPGGYYFTWAIRHIYVYEHPEYGEMFNDDIFYFDPDGYVAGRTNTTQFWRNQKYPAPDWGRGWEKWGPEGLQERQFEMYRDQDSSGQ